MVESPAALLKKALWKRGSEKMIDYKLLQFAAPPFVGADWFVRALQLAGLGPGFVARAYEPFSEGGRIDTVRVSLVRHPLNWLWLVYDSVKDEGSARISSFHVNVNGKSFEEFVESYLDGQSGWITSMFSSYEADIVQRIEDQPDAFLELMEQFNVDGDLSGCLYLKPMLEVKPICNDDLRIGLRRSEHEIFERYDYC